ncbi:MAG: transposase [Magnetococcales bacterium]|nr:transposase [Magnetococcales bacterium]
MTGAVPEVDLSMAVTPMNTREARRLDARLTILDALEAFREASGMGQVEAEGLFVRLYNARAGRLEIPDEIRATVRDVSLATLRRWRKEKREAGIVALAGHYGPRRGADVWSGCEPLRTLVIGLITTVPHVGGKMAWELARARLGEQVEMMNPRTGKKESRSLPSQREFQRFIQRFKSENKTLFAFATNPDRFRGAFRVTAGRMYDGIVRRNQLWEFDASPADCLCLDGRYSLYVMVDVHSRWSKVRITKTPRTEAALLLLRDCILDWGVPVELKTDNGSDFTSRQFMDVVRRIGIQHSLCDAGQPQQKAAVERMIGTIQHGFMEMQPGYIGHSVTDRKQIEARKTFLARLGQPDEKIFCVELTREALQARVTEWIEKKWVFEPHEGLGNKTPFEVRNSYRGPIARIEGEGVLEHLLAPPPDGDGVRTVTGKGIRVNNIHYTHGSLGLLVGQEVQVRLDPDDLGRIYVYQGEPWEFVCVAINPERVGVSRAEVAAKVKSQQKKLLDDAMVEVKEAKKQINLRTMSDEIVADAARRNGSLVSFPTPVQTHTTENISAAIEAMNAKNGQPTADKPLTERQLGKLVQIGERLKQAATPERDEAGIRYANALVLEARLASGETLTEAEAQQLRRYQGSNEYKSRQRLEAFYRTANRS